MTRRRPRILVLATVAILCGTLCCLLILEIILRGLPVNEGLRTLPVDDANPVPRFAPNRTSTWSRGWNFTLTNTVRTNNYGFVNDQPYDPTADTPLLAIVGDSYIEAAMVPFAMTGPARLSRQMAPHLRVYSFGASGAALSQYLAYGRYIRDQFRPAGLVVVIISNDFDESLLKYKNSPGASYFTEDERGALVLTRVDFHPSILRQVAQHSSLAMYLLTNLQITNIGPRAADWWRTFTGSGSKRYVANTAAVVDSERVRDAQRAVDTFLTQLPAASGLDPSRILLAVDGNRQAIYGELSGGETQSSFFDTMRRYVLTNGRAQGYEMLDMHHEFAAHYRLHGQRFEWPQDWHWNTLGHELFAQGVTNSKFIQHLLPQRDSVPQKFAQTPS